MKTKPSDKVLRSLKRIGRINYANSSAPMKEALDHLYDKGYVTWYTIKKKDNVQTFYRITQSGIDHLFEVSLQNRHWRIPVILSVISLVASIAAITLQFLQLMLR